MLNEVPKIGPDILVFFNADSHEIISRIKINSEKCGFIQFKWVSMTCMPLYSIK